MKIILSEDEVRDAIIRYCIARDYVPKTATVEWVHVDSEDDEGVVIKAELQQPNESEVRDE